MAKQFNVYGIGNAIMDLQLRVDEQQFAALGLTKGEMRLVDDAAQQQLLEKLGGGNLNLASGGSAANTMIAIAQLGGTAAYGCIVADDKMGKFYLSEMQQLGISLSVSPQKGGVTGSSVILITPDAERTMNTHLGASASFSAAHISEESIQSADWLYIEGYLFSSESGRAAVERAVEFAKKHATKIAITFSDGFIVEVFGDALRAAVAESDLVFANLNEASCFSTAAEETEIFAELCDLVPNVALTLSERGAWIRLRGETIRAEAYPSSPVDATGAGDIFAGGMLYGITNGLTNKQVAQLSCCLGAKVVSQMGPRLIGDVRSELKQEGFLL